MPQFHHIWVSLYNLKAVILVNSNLLADIHVGQICWDLLRPIVFAGPNYSAKICKGAQNFVLTLRDLLGQILFQAQFVSGPNFFVLIDTIRTRWKF